MKMYNVKIRKAVKEDLNSLAKLGIKFLQLHSAYSPLDELSRHRELQEEQKQWIKFIKDKSYQVIVAELNDKIIGFMTLKIVTRDRMYKISKQGEIEVIIVDTNFTKKGVGNSLYNYAMNYFKSKGIHLVVANIRIGNPAISLARKFGFKEYDTRLYKLL